MPPRTKPRRPPVRTDYTPTTITIRDDYPEDSTHPDPWAEMDPDDLMDFHDAFLADIGGK